MKYWFSDNLPILWRRVILFGNRWNRNMGDEIILIWLIRLLLDKNYTIHIASFNHHYLRSFHNQFLDVSKLHYISELPKWFRSLFRFFWFGWYKDLWHYLTADSIVIGWWEIMTEETPYCWWYWLLSTWISLCTTSRLYLMWGIQIPVKRYNRLLLKFFLWRSSHVFLRDYEWVDVLLDDHYTSPYSSRISFFMDTSYFAYSWRNVRPYIHDRPYILININWKWEKFIDDMIQTIKQYVSKGYDIMYVPICYGSKDDDRFYISRIQKSIHQSLIIVDREKDFLYFLSVVSWSEYVFSPRLHLFLVASYLWSAVHVYPYQHKIIKMSRVIDSLRDVL